jgi:hypothetical protein
MNFSRRHFLTTSLSASAALPLISAPSDRAEYRGPNVIIVRFGGGVRRRETIDPDNTYAPFLVRELAKKGTLFKKMDIAQLEGLNTSHGEGTLNILTGKYDRYVNADKQLFAERFEAKVPTIFEYLRKSYNIPDHQSLIVNGEDRTQEEFYSFSNHHLFGAQFKSNVLSLFRFKVYKLRQDIASGKWTGKELEQKTAELKKMEKLDYRTDDKVNEQGPELNAYWQKWREFYGDTGFVNPRGDRLLTELAIRAIKSLQPKLMMINYNDPDYVHWGNMSHYTRGISIIDRGLEQLYATTQADEEYRDNTVFVIVPDCGRDTNPFADVPCQHHFNSKSSHEIWALLVGPGIARNVIVDKEVQQISIAKTIGNLMSFKTEFTEGPLLEEAMA